MIETAGHPHNDNKEISSGTAEKPKRPMIMYCLHTTCAATKMYTDPDKEWRVSAIRTAMMHNGTADFMMAPGGFCPQHKNAGAA